MWGFMRFTRVLIAGKRATRQPVKLITSKPFTVTYTVHHAPPSKPIAPKRAYSSPQSTASKSTSVPGTAYASANRACRSFLENLKGRGLAFGNWMIVALAAGVWGIASTFKEVDSTSLTSTYRASRVVKFCAHAVGSVTQGRMLDWCSLLSGLPLEAAWRT